MEPKISIVVPVYNVEKYIHKCVNSILKQNFKEFELILVNDGSTDKSGEICDEYREMDYRVKVIHKKNEGQSIARNVAINIARGEYIGFVDSDDWIEEDMYDLLYEQCIANKSDISIIGIREITETNQILNTYIPNFISLSEIIKRAYPCNKLFKKSIIKENDLYFKEGKYYEDLELIPKLFLKSKSVSLINKVGYNYLKRSNSTTGVRDEKIIDNLLAYIELKNFLIDENLYTEYEEEFKNSVKYFKKYYLNMLYDYQTMFLIKNLKVIIITFFKLGEKSLSPYLILLIKHIEFKIKKFGLIFINKIN